MSQYQYTNVFGFFSIFFKKSFLGTFIIILFFTPFLLHGEEPQYLIVDGTLPEYPEVLISDFTGFKKEYCIACHQGIEEISPSHPKNWGCTICHGGDGSTADKKEAHVSRYSFSNENRAGGNPSHLEVASLSCGLMLCHAGHSDIKKNHLSRVENSAMYLQKRLTGIIRYLFGENQGGKVSEQITFADRLNRSACSGCHFDSRGEQKYGRYRSQGCASCHVLYNKDGLYKGGDPTIPRDEPGHPAQHRLTVKIPSHQCNICHKNSKTALSGITFEGFENSSGDIHRELGMECIDCHTSNDVMGDGTKLEGGSSRVEIRCRSCHGSPTFKVKAERIIDNFDSAITSAEYFSTFRNSVGDRMVLTEFGNKFVNVKKEGQQVVLYGKLNGKRYIVPQITGSVKGHEISSHNKRMHCTVCHSSRVPQYYGGMTYLIEQNKKNEQLRTNDLWQTFSKFFRFTRPPLGVTANGIIAPFAPVFQNRFTAVDTQGNILPAFDTGGAFVGYLNRFTFATPDRKSSATSMLPVVPHSIKKEKVKCFICHTNPYALGLGEGRVSFGSNKGKDKIDYLYQKLNTSSESPLPYDALVTIGGQQVSASGYTGNRGFNQGEMNNILRVSLCITCHDTSNDPIYIDFADSQKKFKSRFHNKLMKR